VGVRTRPGKGKVNPGQVVSNLKVVNLPGAQMVNAWGGKAKKRGGRQMLGVIMHDVMRD